MIGSTTFTELVNFVMNDDRRPKNTPTIRPPNITTKNFTIPNTICNERIQRKDKFGNKRKLKINLEIRER